MMQILEKYLLGHQKHFKHMMFDVFNGLLSLYNKCIYQLDVKPENILYNMYPEHYGRYFISDFGFSIKVVVEMNNLRTCEIQSPAYLLLKLSAGHILGLGCQI